MSYLSNNIFEIPVYFRRPESRGTCLGVEPPVHPLHHLHQFPDEAPQQHLRQQRYKSFDLSFESETRLKSYAVGVNNRDNNIVISIVLTYFAATNQRFSKQVYSHSYWQGSFSERPIAAKCWRVRGYKISKIVLGK